ncbi:MAG: hypothetical protein HDQ99_03410, partial [Lachnospiraceae bacterium]|nr:hypothetical protein [Lachnospiraceae bacterium]
MKKVKFVKRAWKKFAAVFLSMILTVGLVSGALPLEVFAEGDKIVVIERLTLDGYEGEGMPDGLILGGHTVHGTGDSRVEKPISSENMTYFMDGNVIVWRVEVEPAEDLKQICLNVRNKLANEAITEYCWSRSISNDLTPQQPKMYEDTLNRVLLISVDHVCRELYLGEGESFNRISQSMRVSAPVYEKHTFQNWKTLEGNLSMDMKCTDPITLYAVYSHPETSTWEANADDVFHWTECTCGEKKKMEAHTEGEGKVVKQPTDTEPGEKTYECTKCHHVRSEVIRSTINYSIIMNGYTNGGDLPDTSKFALWLWKEGHNTGEQPDEIVPLTNTKIEGNKFSFSCAIQDLDTYEAAYIVDGSGFSFPLVDAFLKDGVYEKEFSYYRFRFMDGNEVWNEQYLFSSTWMQEPATPTKENRVFVGWERSDGSIVNLADLKNAAVSERTTLYAVWEHPANDKWEWKSDGDSHWKECDCGDKEGGHTADWDEGVVTKEPTETEAGKKVYRCETCGLMKEVRLSITGSETEEGGDETGNGGDNKGGNESGGETEGGGDNKGGNESGGETEGGDGSGGGNESGGETEGGGDNKGGNESGGETEGGDGSGGGNESGGETEGGDGSGGGNESGGETEGGDGSGGGNECGGG